MASVSYLPTSSDDITSLWSLASPSTLADAKADAAALKTACWKDAQFVSSRCHHHWHPMDPKTKERHPIRGCRSKRGGGCKARYPQTSRLTLIPKAICAGYCRKHELRVAGRRNALGTLLGTRQNPWLSGTSGAIAVNSGTTRTPHRTTVCLCCPRHTTHIARQTACNLGLWHA